MEKSYNRKCGRMKGVQAAKGKPKEERVSKKEKKASKIDWQGIPLESFYRRVEGRGDKDGIDRYYPLGDGALQRFLGDMFVRILHDYQELMLDEDSCWLDSSGCVPLICDGVRDAGHLTLLTFWDLPAVLETFAALEEERERGER